MNLSRTLAASILACGLAATLGAQAKPCAKHDPAKVFRGNCANCHTIPDPAIPTDLAWLDQVHRTS